MQVQFFIGTIFAILMVDTPQVLEQKDGNRLAFQYIDRYPERNFLNHFMVILPLAFDRDYVDYLYVEPVQY